MIIVPKKDTFSWGHVGLQQAGAVLGTLPLPGQAMLAGIQLDKGGWKHSTNPALKHPNVQSSQRGRWRRAVGLIWFRGVL